jgi:hypothetical protein
MILSLKKLHFSTRYNILIWVLLTVQGVNAQENNPFDLLPRLNKTTEISEEDRIQIQEESKNPFDIVIPPQAKVSVVPRNPNIRLEKPSAASDTRSNRGVILTIILSSLVLITVITTAFRSFLNRAYKGFMNRNIMYQLFRDNKAGKRLPYFFLYFLFFFNLAVFLFLVSQRQELTLLYSDLQFLLYLFVGIILLLLSKHFLYTILALFFPFNKEVRALSFTLMIFGIILGFVIAPLNLLLAYGPEELANGSTYAGFGIIIFFYLFKSLRGILIGYKYLISNTFHFLLYICTIEIAPILILAKIALRQL